MKIRLFILLSFVYSHCMAFTCYVTLMKGDCWKNYDVTIDVKNNTSEETITIDTLKKDNMWLRKKFECKPAQSLGFRATFKPKIWKNSTDKDYRRKSFIYLPKTIEQGASAWEVPVCFSSDFTEVPIPPEATGNCGLMRNSPRPLSRVWQSPSSKVC